MKTIKDYEEEFDNFYGEGMSNKKLLKSYIFKQLFPDMLSDMLILETDCVGYPDLRDKRKYFNLRIKQKAKKMGIKL